MRDAVLCDEVEFWGGEGVGVWGEMADKEITGAQARDVLRRESSGPLQVGRFGVENRVPGRLLGVYSIIFCLLGHPEKVSFELTSQMRLVVIGGILERRIVDDKADVFVNVSDHGRERTIPTVEIRNILIAVEGIEYFVQCVPKGRLSCRPIISNHGIEKFVDLILYTSDEKSKKYADRKGLTLIRLIVIRTKLFCGHE